MVFAKQSSVYIFHFAENVWGVGGGGRGPLTPPPARTLCKQASASIQPTQTYVERITF